MDSAYRAHSTEPLTTPVSMRVVEAVAEREGTDALELTEPLYHAIDPDALDSLFEGRLGGEITVRYHGYRVTVTGDGDVELSGRR